MNLEQLQRTFFELIRQPLTSKDRMRTRTAEGRSIKALADELITPSAKLTSFERLELYSQGYWFRILETFDEDFPGLRAVVGKPRFDRLKTSRVGRPDSCSPLCQADRRTVMAEKIRSGSWIGA